jgi:non-ribosomal peptide synthetase component F
MIIRSPYPDVHVPEISLPGYVLEHADQRGAVPAVIDGPAGRTLSYRELNSQVRQVAAGLRERGVANGDMLALCSPNSPEFVIAYYAALSAGAAITTINPVATGTEMAARLTVAGARWLVTTPRSSVPRGGRQPPVPVYGNPSSSGRQKGRPRSHPWPARRRRTRCLVCRLTTSRLFLSPAGRAGCLRE